MKDLQVWFKSIRFRIEPGEDEATNPGRYGKQLAEWLRERLIGKRIDPTTAAQQLYAEVLDILRSAPGVPTLRKPRRSARC